MKKIDKLSSGGSSSQSAATRKRRRHHEQQEQEELPQEEQEAEQEQHQHQHQHQEVIGVPPPAAVVLEAPPSSGGAAEGAGRGQLQGRQSAGEDGKDFIVPSSHAVAPAAPGLVNGRRRPFSLGGPPFIKGGGGKFQHQQQQQHHNINTTSPFLLKQEHAPANQVHDDRAHARIVSDSVGRDHQFTTTGTNASSSFTAMMGNTAGNRSASARNNEVLIGSTPSNFIIPSSSNSPHKGNRTMAPPFLSTTSTTSTTHRHGTSSPTPPSAAPARLSLLGHSSTTTSPSSTSSQPSPTGRRKRRKLPLRTDFSNTSMNITNSAFATASTTSSTNNHPPQHRLLSSSSATGGGIGQNLLLLGNKHSSLSGVVATAADFHRSLVSAIFDVGLTECSPLSIYENMSTRIKDLYGGDFNLEKIKSKLQKYRKFKSKNKEEFMQVYHKTLDDMLSAYPIQKNAEDLKSSSSTTTTSSMGMTSSMIPSTILESLSSGEIAAYLTYEVMKTDACAATESNNISGGGSSSMREKRYDAEHQQQGEQHQRTEHNKQEIVSGEMYSDYSTGQNPKMNHAVLSTQSSSSSLERFLRIESLSKFRTYSDASAALQQATTGFCDTLDFPTLTPEELNSSIGTAFQHFLGLLSSLTCDIYEQRRAGGGGNSISSEAGLLTTASTAIGNPNGGTLSQFSWIPATNDQLGSTMMSMPSNSASTPTMTGMNEWSSTSTPPFIVCNTSHHPLSHRHQQQQQTLQDEGHDPSSLSCSIGKSDEAGAALLAGLSVAPIANAGEGGAEEQHELLHYHSSSETNGNQHHLVSRKQPTKRYDSKG